MKISEFLSVNLRMDGRLKLIALTMKLKVRKCFVLLYRVVDEISVLILFVLSRFSKGGECFSRFRKLNLPIWYHDFSIVGVKTRRFRDGGYDLSQEDKAPILFDYIDRAGKIVRGINTEKDAPISLVDLFCADAYYSLYALHHGLIDSAVGVDSEEGSGEGFIRGGVLDQAATIAKICATDEKLVLNKSDVMTYEGVFDICLCIGGLYHIADPTGLLRRVTAQTRHVLVIQTVIPSIVGEGVPFFVTPAPHWTWGSRFNRKYLTEALEGMGWTISAVDVSPLRANIHAWDNLSLSLLCVKNSAKAK